MATTATMGRHVVLEWHVRPSLLAYLQRMPDFAVRAEGGAEFRGEAVLLPAVERSDGALQASGAIELSGHGGALNLALRGVVLTADTLWIDDPLGELDARPLVLLQPGADGAIETRLAAEADILFLYSYLPGAPFGSLFVREE
ncbi:MAG: hypothetical protein KKH75_02880 [Actinobacteria bacterium]|nr:hypothetical protein [Actinomycetota bacterium]